MIIVSQADPEFSKRVHHCGQKPKWSTACTTGGAFVSFFLLCGCAPRTIYTERVYVEQQLQERSTHTIRDGSNPVEFSAPFGLNLEEELTESNVVEIALWNNAVFQENLSKLGFSRADLLQAGALANPTLSMLFPWGPKQFEFTATFPLEALYLRPKRVQIAEIDAERVAEGLVQGGLDLIRDVRVAFADAALAEERAALNGEAAAVRNRLLEIATAREKAGEGTALEVVAARAEAARAAEELRRAKNDVSVARDRLAFLAGLTNLQARLSPGMIDTNFAELSADLEQKALAARPDLRASELGIEAAGARAGLAKREIFLISGLVDANAKGTEGFEIGPGALITLPIFQQNQSGRTRAKAELERAVWNYAATRQRIVFEVRDAQNKLRQATEALRAFRSDILPPAKELAEQSRRAYELGEIEPLTAQEYARQLIASRLTEVDLIAAVRRALAELERSVGTRLGVETKTS